jgi:hypothetical protein
MKIEQLRALLDESPKGPYYCGSHDCIFLADGIAECVPWRDHPKPDGIATDKEGFDSLVSTGSGEYTANPDAIRVMVAARNALPALLKVAEAAQLVKAANARRANAQVQDCCERTDYEQSMGYACDQLTLALEELERA